MTNITDLPHEMIGYILENKDISFKDIVNLGLTCKRLYETACNNNVLWRHKFLQRWPALEKICKKYWYNKNINYMEEVIEKMKYREELLEYLTTLHYNYYYKQYLTNDDMKDILFSIEENDAHPLKYHYHESELLEILKCSQCHKDTNLTHKYYAKKVLPYIRQCYLKKRWQTFTNLPAEQQLLEWIATFVAKWFQTDINISYSRIMVLLNSIAKYVLEILKKQYPTHSIFSTPTEKLYLWRDNNIDDNQWNKEESTQIIDVLCKVMCYDLKFQEENTYVSNHFHRSCFIDWVLHKKYGNIVSIAIIFHSVARRLGVRCDLVYFPNHFFLSWKENYHTTSEDTIYYIDMHSQSMLTKKDCPLLRGDAKCPVGGDKEYKKLNPKEIILHLITHLQSTLMPEFDIKFKFLILELQHILDPCNTEIIVHLYKISMMHNIDLADTKTMFKETLDAITAANALTPEVELEISNIRAMLNRTRVLPTLQYLRLSYLKPKRTSELKYAIGMIMYYQEYGADKKGVIVGWDIGTDKKEIDMPFTHTHIPQKTYILLTCDKTVICFPQEYIKPKIETDMWIDHEDIGRFFCCFCNTHYIPNTKLQETYPEDAVVRAQWIDKLTRPANVRNNNNDVMT